MEISMVKTIYSLAPPKIRSAQNVPRGVISQNYAGHTRKLLRGQTRRSTGGTGDGKSIKRKLPSGIR